MRDDADLVRLSLEGDQSAYGLALSYVHSFADAEDVAQEAFISAYENLCSLRDPSRFGPWLKSAVVNLCRNWRRRRALLDRSSEEMKREIGEQVGVAPDRLCEAADLQARVLGAIARLSEKNGQAITLYYIDGLSTREIGDFLGVSTGAVDQRLHRGREQLKEEMIDMVEEVLRDSQPHAFPEKVLSEIAGEEAVESVAALLANAELHEDARMALERLPGDKATAALKAALATATDAQKPALAHSLRVRGVETPGVPDMRLVPTKKTKVQPVGR